MKKQQHTKWIAIFAIAIIATLFLTSSSLKVASAEIAVVSVSHSPTDISKDIKVTVEITFNDDTNVSGIQIQYCALVPDFICHFPKIAMTTETENVWNGNFTVVEETGLIGYELLISLTNGSALIAPDSIDYLGYNNIFEPIADTFYFSINMKKVTTNLMKRNLKVSVMNIVYLDLFLAYLKHNRKEEAT